MLYNVMTRWFCRTDLPYPTHIVDTTLRVGPASTYWRYQRSTAINLHQDRPPSITSADIWEAAKSDESTTQKKKFSLLTLSDSVQSSPKAPGMFLSSHSCLFFVPSGHTMSWILGVSLKPSEVYWDCRTLKSLLFCRTGMTSGPRSRVTTILWIPLSR